MTERKALNIALEALNDMACWKEGREVDMGFDEPYAADTSRKAITAIKEALAQPEPDWRALVLNHNADCDARCDMDRCGYKPYYEYNGRRCPDCPVYDKIEAAHGIKGEA